MSRRLFVADLGGTNDEFARFVRHCLSGLCSFGSSVRVIATLFG